MKFEKIAAIITAGAGIGIVVMLGVISYQLYEIGDQLSSINFNTDELRRSIK